MVGCGIVILLVWLLLSAFLEAVCPRVEQCVHREGLYFSLVLLREARYVQHLGPAHLAQLGVGEDPRQPCVDECTVGIGVAERPSLLYSPRMRNWCTMWSSIGLCISVSRRHSPLIGSFSEARQWSGRCRTFHSFWHLFTIHQLSSPQLTTRKFAAMMREAHS